MHVLHHCYLSVLVSGFVRMLHLITVCIVINANDAKMLVTAAETCCEEDVYHFDGIERFFLVSCLALW